MKFKIIALLSFLVCSFYTTAQISVEFETGNKTDGLKDGFAKAIVKGGTPPYQFYWSNNATALTSDLSEKLVEGKEYTLVVTDANGEKAESTVIVPTKNLSESINIGFTPIVDAIGSFLMFDPFAFFGHDNKIYNNEGEVIRHANGDPKTTSIPFIVVWLVIGAIFFTLKMKFVNFRGVRHAVELIRGDYDNPNDKGEVSHFQALVTALSGTVGLGNIVGVAVAITLGGAGATFWMIVAGLIGMSSKFVECTLGVKYRNVHSDGEVSGGPMYYLSKGLKKRGLGGLGKFLAFFFAILCVGGSVGGGNMFQANQAFAQAKSIPFLSFLEGNGVYFGIVLAILVGIVIIGGIKSIANVTDKVVPLMVGIYVLSALIIIGMNISYIGEAFYQIFNGAFSPDALKGGVIGVIIVGFQRAAFSNEAGVGSASIAHSAAKTDEPISEGIVALLEPFIDTVVVCTMTALVLIFTGYADDTQGFEGAELTSEAFKSVLGDWSAYVLAFAAILFAFSTMISWSYYGLKAWTYMLGESKASEYAYKFVFLVFVVIGSSAGLGAVIDFSDFMILGMAFPNILGLVIMSSEVKEDMKDYFARIKSGAIQKFK
ncbi:MAG: amino acid carrier protein [Flavobacteriales bacterium]|jgi:AGCS family alanine or glycine:cation symporter|nr:amino acid carrier protein [Flavobacteriales bacterium]